jgi:hypothetical protein
MSTGKESGRILSALAPGASVAEFNAVLNEIEDAVGASPSSPSHGASIDLSSVSRLVCTNSGLFEDQAELEDALQSSLPTFVHHLPHIDLLPDGHSIKANELIHSEQSEAGPIEISVTLSSLHDLDTVVMRSRFSWSKVDAAGVTMQPDGQRRINTVRGHIAEAAEHLKSTSDVPQAGMKLEQLLELQQSFSFVVSDESGFSEAELGRHNVSVRPFETDNP